MVAKKVSTGVIRPPLEMLRWLADNYTFGKEIDGQLKKLVAVDPFLYPPPELACHCRIESINRMTFCDAQHAYDCVIERGTTRTVVYIGCRGFSSRADADAGWDKSGRSSKTNHIRKRRHELIAWIADVCAYRGWNW